MTSHASSDAISQVPPNRFEELIESPLVQNFILAVIVINAIVLGLATSADMMERYGGLITLIDRAALKAMQPTAALINVARGVVVAEDDLFWALQNHEIHSAAEVSTATPTASAFFTVALFLHLGESLDCAWSIDSSPGIGEEAKFIITTTASEAAAPSSALSRSRERRVHQRVSETRSQCNSSSSSSTSSSRASKSESERGSSSTDVAGTSVGSTPAKIMT